MTYQMTNWADRIVEYPNRIRLQDNSDGTFTIIPEPGNVIQTGTAVSATNMNKIEQGIEDAHNDISTKASKSEVGDISALSTTDKTNTVAAINEVVTQMAELAVPLYQTLKNDGASIISMPSSAEGQICVESIKGQSIYQGVKDGNVATSVTSDSSSTAIGIKEDGTWLFSNSYSASEQTFLVENGKKYFAYWKLKNSSVGKISNLLLMYDNGSKTELTGFSDNLEVGEIITAEYTGLANMKVRESTAGLVERDYQLLIPMSDLGIENYTKEQMLEIARAGYWTGVKSTVSHRIKSVGKNIFNISKVINGSLNSVGVVNNGGASHIINGNEITITASSSYRGIVSDYIPVEANTSYISKGVLVSGSGTNPYIASVCYYDSNRNFINRDTYASGQQQTFTTPANAKYCRFDLINATVSTPSVIKEMQLEEGTAATTFEEYQESIQYITLPTGEEIRSLPNGVKDEIKDQDGKLYKETEKYALQSADIFAMQTNYNNLDYVRIQLPNDAAINLINHLKVMDSSGALVSYYNGTVDSAENIGKWLIYDDNLLQIRVGVVKGTSLEDVQTALAGYSLIYQLAEEKVYNLNTTPLTIYPDGTVMFEKAIPEVSFYDNSKGCQVSHTKYPISNIDFIRKINKVDGSYIELDVSKAVLAGNQLGFTHPDLTQGDLVDWDYYYPEELSTIPDSELTIGINHKAQTNSNTKAIQNLSEITQNIEVLTKSLQLGKAEQSDLELLTYNQYNMLLQMYYDGKYPLYKGMFFDGFLNNNEVYEANNLVFRNGYYEILNINTYNKPQASYGGGYTLGKDTTNYKLGQKIVLNDPIKLNSVPFDIYKIGTPGDSVVVKLLDADKNLMATSNPISSSVITTSTSYATETAIFPTQPILLPNTYYLEWSRTGSINSSHYYKVETHSGEKFLSGYGYTINASGTWTLENSCIGIGLTGVEYKPLSASLIAVSQTFENKVENATLYIKVVKTGNVAISPKISINNGTIDYKEMRKESETVLSDGSIELKYTLGDVIPNNIVDLKLDIARESTSDFIEIHSYGCILGVV